MTTSNTCCSVNGKIKCVFEPHVVPSTSNKRKGQNFKVTASEDINKDFAGCAKNGKSRLTMKLDGTCCFVCEFNGRPWLWARHDVKPNKAVDKKFKAYLHTKNECQVKNGNDEQYPTFEWNIETDFKEFPDNWISASGADKEHLVPDDIGHLVGWVPIDPSLRTHLWHLSVVDLNMGLGLFLTESNEDEAMQVCIRDLKSFIGQTFELIGTNVNANPYGLGCKKEPLHVLVKHGEISVTSFPPLEHGWNHEMLKTWFASSGGQMEGVVWHCEDGRMFKLHRHHLDLRWPVSNVFTHTRKVVINTDNYDHGGPYKNKLFDKLKKYSGKCLESMTTIFNEEDS